MIAKIVTPDGKTVREPHSTDRIPGVGEVYQVGDAIYNVKSHHTQHPVKEGDKEIVVVTIEKPKSKKQQLNG